MITISKYSKKDYSLLKNSLGKYSAAILLMNLSFGWAADAKDIFNKMVKTGLKTRTTSFTIESRFKSVNVDTLMSVKVEVLIKRDSTIPDLRYKIRGQYEKDICGWL